MIKIATLGALLAVPLAAQTVHGPIRIAAERDGSISSNNWSGYAVNAARGSVTDVKASWIVPAATCESGTQYAAFWVGIDGFKSKTVEQTGTDSDCSHGTPSYYAWYEFFPQPSFIIASMTLTPGDLITAEVSFAGGKFTVSITDVTTGASFHKTERVLGAEKKSAEWVAEAPTGPTGIEPLANFGTALFGEDGTGAANTCFATINGETGPLGAFPNITQITMVSLTGATEAVPSALSTDLTSFSDTWVSQ